MCDHILNAYKKLAVKEGPQGAAVQVTSQLLAGPTGWVSKQSSALQTVPVTLIGGNYFTQPGGDPAVWPNDTLVALQSAHATGISDDIIPARVCVTRPDVHTLDFTRELNLPYTAALTWDPRVIDDVNQAIIRTESSDKVPNRTGC